MSDEETLRCNECGDLVRNHCYYGNPNKDCTLSDADLLWGEIKKACEETIEETLNEVEVYLNERNIGPLGIGVRNMIKLQLEKLKSSEVTSETRDGGVESSKEDKTNGLIEGVQNSPTPVSGERGKSRRTETKGVVSPKCLHTGHNNDGESPRVTAPAKRQDGLLGEKHKQHIEDMFSSLKKELTGENREG